MISVSERIVERRVRYWPNGACEGVDCGSQKMSRSLAILRYRYITSIERETNRMTSKERVIRSRFVVGLMPEHSHTVVSPGSTAECRLFRWCKDAFWILACVPNPCFVDGRFTRLTAVCHPSSPVYFVTQFPETRAFRNLVRVSVSRCPLRQ